MLPRSLVSSGVLVVLVACSSSSGGSGGSSGGSGTSGASTTSTSSTSTTATTTSTSGGTSGPATSSTSSASTGSGGSSTAAVLDMGGMPVDPCADGTAFCEDFDTYGAMAFGDGQTFGPWRAAVSTAGATMDLDGTHTVSGDHALHVRLEQGTTSGGRLFTNGDVPLLNDSPTHVYGRMMMYIDPNGTSIHWTFFGVSGQAEPTSPLAGNNASYIMSSLPSQGVNTYAFVDGLSGGANYQDCSTRGMEPMPTGTWSCISFEMDTLARKLRMYKDGGTDPIVSVDDHGAACVAPTPSDATWWGPLIDTFFVGTWSFHDMDAPLEVWIDDLVVDTVPVDCPP